MSESFFNHGKKAHPLPPHRKTGQSGTQTHGHQVGGATSGATLSLETRNTLQPYPLWRNQIDCRRMIDAVDIHSLHKS